MGNSSKTSSNQRADYHYIYDTFMLNKQWHNCVVVACNLIYYNIKLYKQSKTEAAESPQLTF